MPLSWLLVLLASLGIPWLIPASRIASSVIAEPLPVSPDISSPCTSASAPLLLRRPVTLDQGPAG